MICVGLGDDVWVCRGVEEAHADARNCMLVCVRVGLKALYHCFCFMFAQLMDRLLAYVGECEYSQ
jgi:hypothetical protein